MKTAQFFLIRFRSINLLILVTILILISNYRPVLAQTTETNPKYWARYDNKELGISFKHPMNWTKREMRDGLYLLATQDMVGPSGKPPAPYVSILKMQEYEKDKVQSMIKNKKFIESRIGEYRTFEATMYTTNTGWLSTIFEVEKDKTYFIFSIQPFGEHEPWGPRMQDIFQKILDTVEFY